MIQTSAQLRQKMEKIDRKPYPAYKDLKGTYQFEDYQLKIMRVQSDPYARASDVQVILKNTMPASDYDTPYKKRALSDYLLRLFEKNLRKSPAGKNGSKKESLLSIQHPGQQVLERSAIQITSNLITLSFHVSFPAAGRKILISSLMDLFFDRLPELVQKSLIYGLMQPADQKKLAEAVSLSMDQHELRAQMKDKGLVAFVANGAVLPRKSGNCDLPLEKAVPFQSPESMEVKLSLSDGRPIYGMGIRQGVTLICGGGYHGKSTLLNALEKGVYDHIKEDGREYVLAVSDAVKVRAEDGRSIQNEDISAFIQNLPQKKDTGHFCTENASGSTSQAAAVMEAVHSGSSLLLIDEDTSASNFLFRDEFMEKIIPEQKEPIIPLLHHMRNMYEQKGISTILVAGSSSAFFAQAGCILSMDEYEPKDITKQVAQALQEWNLPAHPKALYKWNEQKSGFQLQLPKAAAKNKIKVQSTDALIYNHQEIDVKAVEQLAETGQLKAAGHILLKLVESHPQQSVDFNDIRTEIEQHILPELLKQGGPKDLSEIRLQDLAAVYAQIRN